MDSFSISPDAVTVPSGCRLVGRVRVPASKSLTHRVLALALLARRPLVIEGALDADDTRRTLAAVRAAGIAVEASGSRLKMLPGPMPDGPVEVDCGEAGTALRLLTGLLATQAGE
ncbi:MAG: bifunctional 3-phosphoshikimate 1-carboxyvinyltransferase/cytidylate kinase, partial [Actinobacteria bacterium]|nr:bifunctional 3-phosphoshikimate 1-carboxyvinyltransferase/cytidylate kinase [Actinomycetota bacterium]